MNSWMKYEFQKLLFVLHRGVLLLLLVTALGFPALAQNQVYIAACDQTHSILQLANTSQSNGTALVVGERNDANTSLQNQQLWYYDKATHTIRLKANPNKCIARKGQLSVKDPIVLADVVPSGDPNSTLQCWILENSQIKLLADKNLCIGLLSANFNIGNTAVLSNVSSSDIQQKWYYREKPLQSLTADGKRHRVDSPGETYLDLYIPDPCPYQYLNIQAQGGDGGMRSVHNLLTKNEDIKANGGQGATMYGTYKIGSGPMELKPGTNLRFVIGRAGQSVRNNANDIGGGGGGGTGVLYESVGTRPSGFSYYPWEMLMVAGGGGGGYADCCNLENHNGIPANNDTPVANGSSKGITYMECDGWNFPEVSGDGNHYGFWLGSGFRVNTDPSAKGRFNGEGEGFGYIDGPMLFPLGGKNVHNDHFGGYGFGGGGSNGWNFPFGIIGCGGGYSGGNVQSDNFYGAGGGSYVHADWAVPYSISKIKNTTTANPADGYVEYQFINNGLSTRDLYFECHKGTEVQVLKSGDWTLLWQYDGNLVLYGLNGAAWASNTAGTDLFFQGDGNLVIYQTNAEPWSTDTPDDHHDGKGGRKLVLTAEGSLFIADQDGKVIWKGR